MKSNFKTLGPLIALLLVVSMLLPLAHSYEHLYHQISTKTCQHHYRSSKEITHQHKSENHCQICQNSIGNFIGTEFYSFEFAKIHNPTTLLFNTQKEGIPYFAGSLFALRAPPAV